MSNENLARLGELITLRRAQLGITGTQDLADRTKAVDPKRRGVSKRAVDAIIGQENVPQARTQRLLEEVLGWWTGSIAELLRAEDPAAFTLDGMATGDAPAPATRASDLTDDELLVEVMHRMRDWRAWTERSAAPAEEPDRDLFGLAALRNSEEPGEDEEDV